MPSNYTNTTLFEVMLKAFDCPHFGVCPEAKFSPVEGLVPRGFLGAASSFDRVKAIFVLAEPGHPLRGQIYSPQDSRADNLRLAIENTYACFRDGANQFHRNLRAVLSMIWPHLSFDEQLNHVWITESRLCSIDNEIGNVRDPYCAKTHFVQQLPLMSDAIVVTFGRKARDRIRRLPEIKARTVVHCKALSPPGCNRSDAIQSWEEAARVVRMSLKT